MLPRENLKEAMRGNYFLLRPQFADHRYQSRGGIFCRKQLQIIGPGCGPFSFLDGHL
jgi:hypothetical protein